MKAVKRWSNFKTKFNKNLVNKVKKAKTTYYDYTISPAIRQSLLHWEIEIIKGDLLS